MEFLKQALRGKNDWHYYLIGIMLVALGYIVGQLPLMAIFFRAIDTYKLSVADVQKFMATNDFKIIHVSSNLGMVLMLSLFVFAAVGMAIALKIHKKTWLDIITTRPKFDWGRFFYGFGVWMVIGILMELAFYFYNPDNYHFEVDWYGFIFLILIGIFILPIQTSMEEIFFRGYLAQGLYLLTKHAGISIILPGILFSLVHSMNPEIKQFGFWPMQIYYVGAGLFLALLAYADKGLELAMGVHFATNFFGMAFVTYQGAVLQTDSIFTIKETNAWVMSLGFFVAAAIFIAIASKKYKWSFARKAT